MRKLYLLTNTKGNGCSGSENCIAISDSGKVLAQHLCSSVAYMYDDLYGRRPERKEMWEEEFGGKEGETFEVIIFNPVKPRPMRYLRRTKNWVELQQ